YAGLCGYNNIISHSKDYFHAISIEEFQRFINRTSCETLVETGNTPPTVSIRQGGFVIPINTPFVLEAEGSDVDSDVLTYSWEQFDKAQKEENLADKPLSNGFDSIVTAEEIEDYYLNEHDWSYMISFWESQNMTEDQIDSAKSANIEDQVFMILALQERYEAQKWEGDGPLFRSYPPTNDNKRYFPRLKDLVKGKSTIFEVMPFKTRELNFVITVKDNKAGLTNDLLTFSSTDQAGPFVVTSTFSDSPYTGYSTYNVEWDVANTDIAPVNCQQVDILFSDNGGESFDYVLLENTGNDGSENVQLPNIATSKGRIMVKASENVFFNVNDVDFQINSIEVDIPEAPFNLTGSQVGVSKVTLS
ncbi:MAG: hypothetical protein MI892_05135, partial [Desulfobacterales bacterium]|nr:hypothetical protein [Desulfobacterales bacterium]